MAMKGEDFTKMMTPKFVIEEENKFIFNRYKLILCGGGSSYYESDSKTSGLDPAPFKEDLSQEHK